MPRQETPTRREKKKAPEMYLLPGLQGVNTELWVFFLRLPKNQEVLSHLIPGPGCLVRFTHTGQNKKTPKVNFRE